MITSYQFVKFKEETFVDFHHQLAKQNTISCFDFEDSIIDFKQNDTNRYKTNYRDKVIALIKNNCDSILNAHLGFRINEYGNSRYCDDISSLEELNGLNFKCLFLSDVDSPAVLQRFLDENKHLNFDEVIPIVENNISFSNIKDILMFKHPKFKNIAFGHCDYNLSCNLLPMIHQDNPRYWSWIQKFETLCKQENIGYINSPYLNLNHSSHFNLMLKNTGRFFDDWGQITLNTQQSVSCYRFNDQDLINVREFDIFDGINIMGYAKKIVDLFEKYNPEGRGYTIMPDTKIFICPHEYLAAKRYMSE